MGKKAIILYISRVVNYSYELHFHQSRALPKSQINSTFYVIVCVYWDASDCIVLPNRFCFSTSPAVTTYCGTNLFADGCGSAQTINPDLLGGVWGGGFPMQWHMCECSPKAHSARGWSGLPLWMTAPGNILEFDLWWLVKEQRDQYVSTSHCKWAFTNCSIIFLCNSMFRIKHWISIFYNYTGLWSCHHHVKTAKKLVWLLFLKKKKSFKENVGF